MPSFMRFHAPISGDKPLELPLALGHFVPWFTIRGGDYPLPAADREPLEFLPEIDDYRHWNDRRAGYRRTHHHIPAIGLYDSRDPKVIEWQIRTALDHEVGGFIVNWYGKHSVENVITLHWLRGLAKWNREHPDRPFHYFISLDAQMAWPTEGKKPVPMEEDLGYVRDRLVTDAYLRRDGRLVFTVFPYEKNCAQWRRALDGVFGAGKTDLLWSSEMPGEGENGCYAWVQPDEQTVKRNDPHVWSNPDNCGEGFLRNLYWNAGKNGAAPEYVMAGAWPGFNNQFVSWAWSPDPNHPSIRPCVICRETTRGNTLDLTWRVYMEYLAAWAKGDPAARAPVPLIQLVTWNDYAETTTVEPALDYGTAPLETCRKYITEARRTWKTRATD